MKCFTRPHHNGRCFQYYLLMVFYGIHVWIQYDMPTSSDIVTAWMLQSPHGCHNRPLLDRTRSHKYHHRLDLRSLATSFHQIQPTEVVSEEQEQQQPSSMIQTRRKQRIAIIGTGAVGSYYGARLWEIGHDVHFLLRNDNYDTARRQGLQITSVTGNIYIPPQQIQAYPTTQDMMNFSLEKSNNDTSTNAGFDWVIVALKSSSLDAIPDLIIPLLNPNTTRVLVIMNGMIENDLLQLMKSKTGQQSMDNTSTMNEPLQCCHTWYGGMALICCNRIASCHIDHTYFGLLTAGVASTKDSSSEACTNNERAFRELFQHTKIDVAYDTSLLRGRWSKMIWNLPFNGISVAMGGITVDQIVNDTGLRQLAYHIMDETILAANTDLQRQYGAQNFVPLGATERTAMMQLSDDMGPYKPSTMLDFVHRRSMEVQYLFRTPLDRAKQLNVSTPYLETIVLQIEAYQRMYNLL
jgi:2-dehydropantoate 2-reductase